MSHNPVGIHVLQGGEDVKIPIKTNFSWGRSESNRPLLIKIGRTAKGTRYVRFHRIPRGNMTALINDARQFLNF
jgi:hypothetical protein